MKRFLILVALIALTATLPVQAANPDGSPVELFNQAFTNVVTRVVANTTSNFVSNPIRLPKNTPFTLWFKGRGWSSTGGTNAFTTNVTVVNFALSKTSDTNWQETARVSMYVPQNGSNWIVFRTNIAAAVHSGSAFIIPLSIEYPSDIATLWMTNITLECSYPR